MTNLHAKYEDCGSKESLVIGRTSFLSQGPCDLWPSDPKIIRGHVLIITNLYTKHEDWGPNLGIYSYLADKLFKVKAPVTMIFDQVTQKSKWVIY
jgi:hypothetical protein